MSQLPEYEDSGLKILILLGFLAITYFVLKAKK